MLLKMAPTWSSEASTATEISTFGSGWNSCVFVVNCSLALIKAESQVSVHSSLAQGGPFKESVSGLRAAVILVKNQKFIRPKNRWMSFLDDGVVKAVMASVCFCRGVIAVLVTWCPRKSTDDKQKDDLSGLMTRPNSQRQSRTSRTSRRWLSLVNKAMRMSLR